MRGSSTVHRVLPADWEEVLRHGQQALQQAEAEAAKRAAALEQSAGSAAPAGEEPPWTRGLAEVQARLDGLPAYADAAARSVAEVDATLGAGEEALRGWLTASEVARRKLAEWVARG
jgi:hypothetical protein